MIDIEEGALRALEQDAFAVIGELLEYLCDVGHARRNRFRSLQCTIQGLREIDRPRLEVVLQ